MDPSIHVTPSCVWVVSGEWVVEHDRLPFKHMTEYKEALTTYITNEVENQEQTETTDAAASAVTTTTTTTTTNNNNNTGEIDSNEFPEWYYKGEDNEIFGAFSLTQMIAWYSGGHLPSNLLVRQGEEDDNIPSNFVLLSSIDAIVNVVTYEHCNEWYYWTEEGSQGPFTHAQMSVWLEHGYLEATLLVKRGDGAEALLISTLTEGYIPLSNYLDDDFSQVNI